MLVTEWFLRILFNEVILLEYFLDATNNTGTCTIFRYRLRTLCAMSVIHFFGLT